jgi:hypothetical protein
LAYVTFVAAGLGGGGGGGLERARTARVRVVVPFV